MIYRRVALTAILLAALASAYGTSQISEGTTAPIDATTPLVTTAPRSAPAAPLPLGESTLEAVEFFYELPEVVARAVLAKTSDSNTWDPNVSFWMNRLERKIGTAPMIYQIYTGAD